MKVQELRDLLRSTDRVLADKAFIECYKSLPKAKKEEMDEVIKEIFSGKEKIKNVKTEGMDFRCLEEQITEFLENAYAQNYFAPNRVIPKNQRPKWRFLVKNYIKELEKVPTEGENHARSVKLFTDLYRMLCYACNYYLFSTDDPFRSVGWPQPEVFGKLVKHTFSQDYSRENIRNMIQCATNGGVSREALPIMQEWCLCKELKTRDAKYLALEEAQKILKETKSELLNFKGSSRKQYEYKEAIENLCDMILLISGSLEEEDEGIRCYFTNYGETNREITLYCALSVARYMEDNRLWLKIYEYGIEKKIKPREGLVEQYQRRLKEQPS